MNLLHFFLLTNILLILKIIVFGHLMAIRYKNAV